MVARVCRRARKHEKVSANYFHYRKNLVEKGDTLRWVQIGNELWMGEGKVNDIVNSEWREIFQSG